MDYKLTATAPTHYQINSLRSFGIGCYKKGNGSFYGEEIFSSKEEGKKYMELRAEMYNESDPEGSKKKLKQMFADIKKGHLTLDAVTATLSPVEEDN